MCHRLQSLDRKKPNQRNIRIFGLDRDVLLDCNCVDNSQMHPADRIGVVQKQAFEFGTMFDDVTTIELLLEDLPDQSLMKGPILGVNVSSEADAMFPRQSILARELGSLVGQHSLWLSDQDIWNQLKKIFVCFSRATGQVCQIARIDQSFEDQFWNLIESLAETNSIYNLSRNSHYLFLCICVRIGHCRDWFHR